MQTEIEAKFTDIDLDDMRSRLKKVGATLVTPERLMRRKKFGPHGSTAYARVRDEGDKITMTYKVVEDWTLHGTKEINLVVNDFDAACAFLEAIGMKQKAYIETRRENWSLNGCDIALDTWPWIPSFVEVEGPSEEAVRSTAALLGCDWGRALHGTVEPVYRQNYDVTDEEIDHWETVTFVPVPAWLEAKRIAH